MISSRLLARHRWAVLVAVLGTDAESPIPVLGRAYFPVEPPPAGSTRTYFVAAEEVAWNFAPSGRDEAMGHDLTGFNALLVSKGQNRIGSAYTKALYREYTDSTFSTPVRRGDRWAHLGSLGPVLRAQVGDTIRVVFRNNARFPFSMHPHGVFYRKDSEGAPYADGTGAGDKADDAVPPGGTHTYVWAVPDRAGPGPRDPDTIVWLYHSHSDEARDTQSGLVGPIIIGRRGALRADGTPLGIDREFVALFMVMDENQSRYLDHNIASNGLDSSTVKKDGLFRATNFKQTINGYTFGNLPLDALTMRSGDRVRWYVLGLGTSSDMHTPHWHGHSLTVSERRTDVVTILPAQMLVADMVADNPGTWMFHCHVSDHMTLGMQARFRVLPSDAAGAQPQP